MQRLEQQRMFRKLQLENQGAGDGSWILEMVKKQFEEKEKEDARKAAVLALFKDDEDRESYGFTNKCLSYMRKAIRKFRKELTIEEGKLKKEDDYLAVDDIWLDLYQMMQYKFKKDQMKERLDQYYASNPEQYRDNALAHIEKMRAIKIRAGECICKYLDLEFRTLIFERPSGEPTIVDFIDPIQLMLPTVKKAQ